MLPANQPPHRLWQLTRKGLTPFGYPINLFAMYEWVIVNAELGNTSPVTLVTPEDDGNYKTTVRIVQQVSSHGTVV
jgi:hypothetical protein